MSDTPSLARHVWDLGTMLNRAQAQAFRIHDAGLPDPARDHAALNDAIDRLVALRQRLIDAKWKSCTADAEAITTVLTEVCRRGTR